MYQTLKHLHSGFRYIVFVFIIIAIISALIGWLGNRKFTSTNKKINLFTLISAHTQLLIGLVLYFVSDITKSALSNWSVAMKNPDLRYWAIEHFAMMVIAIALITIGYSKSKKANLDIQKHRNVAIFYGLAFIIIVAAIVQSGRTLFGS